MTAGLVLAALLKVSNESPGTSQIIDTATDQVVRTTVGHRLGTKSAIG